MAAKGRVIPNCVNASNPYHECTESCLRKITEAKPQKKNSGSFKDYRNGIKNGEPGKNIIEGKRGLQTCPKASNPYHQCDENCYKRYAEPGADSGSILAVPVLSRRKKQEPQPGSSNISVSKALLPSTASSPKSLHSANKNVEPLSNGQTHSPLPAYSGELKIQSSSVITEQYQSPRREPTSEILKPDLPNHTPKDAVLTSPIPPTSKEKEEKEEKGYDPLQDLTPNDDGSRKEAASSPGLSLDFSFMGVVHSDGESDDGAQSIASESRVPVGKYLVKESLASVLLSIMDKHGDIAANCQLESLAMRSYYLECVCLVVQELQATSLMQLTKSKVKELLAILKDAESAQISVAWLRGVLNEIAEDIELITQHRTLESEKSNCDHDLESTREELETELEILAQKEKEIAATKEEIAEARNRLTELELKSSELSKSMLSIKSEVDRIHGKSLDELL